MTLYPKISIVTPNYNLGGFLEKTILSVISQGYPNLEYVMVDGGSTDESRFIIDKYRHHFSTVIIEKDRGHSDALNKGLRVASGSIMGWINSDDILLPGSLFLMANIFSSLPRVHWIQGNQTHLSEDGMIIRSTPSRSLTRLRFLSGDFRWIQQESTFWSRELWEAAGGYIDESVDLAVDFELWLRFFRYAELYPVQGGLGAFRFRENQRSSQVVAYENEALKLIDRELARLPLKYKQAHRKILPCRARSLAGLQLMQNPALRREDVKPLRYSREATAYVNDNLPTVLSTQSPLSRKLKEERQAKSEASDKPQSTTDQESELRRANSMFREGDYHAALSAYIELHQRRPLSIYASNIRLLAKRLGLSGDDPMLTCLAGTEPPSS